MEAELKGKTISSLREALGTCQEALEEAKKALASQVDRSKMVEEEWSNQLKASQSSLNRSEAEAKRSRESFNFKAGKLEEELAGVKKALEEGRSSNLFLQRELQSAQTLLKNEQSYVKNLKQEHDSYVDKLRKQIAQMKETNENLCKVLEKKEEEIGESEVSCFLDTMLRPDFVGAAEVQGAIEDFAEGEG